MLIKFQTKALHSNPKQFVFSEKFNSIIVNYPNFFYVIKRVDQQIYVIKRSQEKVS